MGAKIGTFLTATASTFWSNIPNHPVCHRLYSFSLVTPRFLISIWQVRGHPNIVGLLGICDQTSVSEYFALRLDDLVFGAPEKIHISRIVPMALDAARGLQALHEVPGGAIVHFDIKPQQIMIDTNGRIKINDFNMCRFTDADANGNLCPFKGGRSNLGPWRSPENIEGEVR